MEVDPRLIVFVLMLLSEMPLLAVCFLLIFLHFLLMALR